MLRPIRSASAEHLPPVGEQTARRDAASHDHNALAHDQPHQEGTVGGRFPGHGGQGGTSQASRDAALANQKHQGQGPEPRDAERQRVREADIGHAQAAGRREGQP